MRTVLEKVARALCLDAGLDPDRKFASSDYGDGTDPQELAWHEFQPAARAALRAFREAAGFDAEIATRMSGNELAWDCDAAGVAAVRAVMIDHALNEGGA